MRHVPAGAAGVLAALASTLAGPGPRPGAAQASELRLEVGASRILPPTGVDGSAAGFAVAGLRGSLYGVSGSGAYGSVLAGKALDPATGGDFLSGGVGGVAALRLGRGWSAQAEGRAFGFVVGDPFSYQAGAFEGSLALRHRMGPISATVTGIGGLGRSRTVFSTVVQRMRRSVLVQQALVEDLWHYGTEVAVMGGGRTVAAGVAGGVHETAGGTFRSVGVRIVSAGTVGVVELRVDAWHTPEGERNTGGLTFSVPWGAWSVRGTAGRPEPDPLLLAEPGREAGGVLLGRRIVGREPPKARVALYDVVGEGADGTRVRFVLNAPQGTQHVAVLGDFTLWESHPMTERGQRWSVELDIRPGTYHFGFLVDGAWYVPADATDAVPDEWGRRSATLVIEPEAGS